MLKLVLKIFCLLIVFAVLGGGNDLKGQKKSRSKAKAKGTVAHIQVPAQAGDTLTTIAKRTGLHPIQLARLNGLSPHSKLKAGQLVKVPSTPTPETTAAPDRKANGKLIRFEDGGSLQVDDAWWRGPEVWYTQGKLTAIANRKVKSIETAFVAHVDPNNNLADPPALTVEMRPEKAGTWIYLHGGAKLKVEQVTEQSDGAWYQRGNLLTFLDRSRIARIERDVFDVSSAAWQERGWTSGSETLDHLIRANAKRFGVDPYLVFLVIEQESHFRSRAVSPKGARGLMQLMPGTARRFGVTQSFDPAQNIRGGTQYLKELLTMFNGRVDLALASYNAGEGRVVQYGHKVPPFRETREYVKRIGSKYSSNAGSRQAAQKSARTGE